MSEILSLSIDGKNLKLARLKLMSKMLRLQHLEEVKLIKGLQQKPTSDIEKSESDQTEEPEDIFGIEGEEEESDSETEQDELFDLSHDEADTIGTPDTNEILLSNLFSGINQKKIDCVLTVSTGGTVFHLLSDHDYRDLKSKEVKNSVIQKLQNFYGADFPQVLWAAEVQENGSLLISSIEKNPQLLKLVERTIPLYSGKVFIKDIIPAEMALVGLIRANHDLQPGEISAVVQLTEKSTRIMILEGNTIRNIIPLINEGYSSGFIMNTVFSKILLELDQGNIPKIDRVILDNPDQAELQTSMLDRFPDIKVMSIQLDAEKIEVHPNLVNQTSQFHAAIAAAWSCWKHDNDAFPQLSLLPHYIIDRQKVLKLEWHGVAMLILVALTPIIFNHLYQERTREAEMLDHQISLTEEQIIAQQPIKSMVDSMMTEHNMYQAKLTRLDSLSTQILRYSRTLEIISEGFRQVNSSWLTALKADANSIQIEGYSLYRSRIPRLASIFADAEILEITGEEVREITMYKFIMQINKVTETPIIFEPIAAVEF